MSLLRSSWGQSSAYFDATRRWPGWGRTLSLSNFLQCQVEKTLPRPRSKGIVSCSSVVSSFVIHTRRNHLYFSFYIFLIFLFPNRRRYEPLTRQIDQLRETESAEGRWNRTSTRHELCDAKISQISHLELIALACEGEGSVGISRYSKLLNECRCFNSAAFLRSMGQFRPSVFF